MQSIIFLKFKDKTIGSYNITEEQVLNIGRMEENDVIIDNIAVSGRHAWIVFRNNGFLLEDLNSKNGTFVNEKLVTSHMLRDGDVITIGKHDLLFLEAEKDTYKGINNPVSSDLIFSSKETSFLDTEKYREMMSKNNQNAAQIPKK